MLVQERSRNKFKMVLTNARSIVNECDEISVLFEDLKPDIFGVTESWLIDDINTAEISYPGYMVYRQDRVDTHRGIVGGVFVICKG